MPPSTMHKLILRSSTRLANSFMNILINLKSWPKLYYPCPHTKSYYPTAVKLQIWDVEALPYCCKLTYSVLKIYSSWWQPWTKIIQLGEWVGNSFTYLEVPQVIHTLDPIEKTLDLTTNSIFFNEVSII